MLGTYTAMGGELLRAGLYVLYLRL